MTLVKPFPSPAKIVLNGVVYHHERSLIAAVYRAEKTEKALLNAKTSFTRITEIRWGWDGDCGANNIANYSIDAIDEALAARAASPSP